MAYSDEEYFLTKINQEELDKLTGEDEEGVNLESAIAAADSLIDSYLSSKTTTPLDEPPEIIKQLSYDIAIFYLHDRIQYNDIPERVKDKYDAALNFLKDIASGKAGLPGIDDEDIEGSVQYDVNTPVFDRDTI